MEFLWYLASEYFTDTVGHIHHKTSLSDTTLVFFHIGLGVRGLSFFQHGDNDDLHFGLMEAFPQLKEGGAYELLKANQSRMLEVIPSPADGYTASYLKDVVGQGKV